MNYEILDKADHTFQFPSTVIYKKLAGILEYFSFGVLYQIAFQSTLYHDGKNKMKEKKLKPSGPFALILTTTLQILKQKHQYHSSHKVVLNASNAYILPFTRRWTCMVNQGNL